MAYEYEDKIPTWENQGTEPADSIKTEGYKAGYKPPAAYFNWFWSHVLNWLNDLRTKVSSLHTQVGTLETKIENIGTTGSGDMSSADILTKLKTVDGSESGLDADTLDGMDATDFATADHTHTQYAAKTHNHSLATATSNGFMSSEMFTKLEGIDPDNLGSGYTHPSTHPASMITGLSTVATTGNYADLVNRPTLSAVATSNDYNDLTNKPAAYVHPTTHPASMIEETENIKMFLAEERAKLAAIEAQANNYVHPDSHPASMITGLSDQLTSLGYGKVISGTYVGTGTDSPDTKNVDTLKANARAISLPFTPTMMILHSQYHGGIIVLTPDVGVTGTAIKNAFSTTITGDYLSYIYGIISDECLYVVSALDKAGYTYTWIMA